MDLITQPCIRCRLEPVIIPDHQTAIGGICDKCIAVEEQLKKDSARAQAIKSNWDAICPLLYQDTEVDLLPQVELSMRALKWPYMMLDYPGRDCSWMGLNLWGFPGTGKTRTMLLVLKKAHFAGRRVKFFGPSQFAQELEMRDFKTASWIRNVTAYDIVAFDDLDKCKLTRQQEEKFFALLDSRIARRVPTFFTGNTQGEVLKTYFRNGEAIIRRIREHSFSLHFPQQQQLKL